MKTSPARRICAVLRKAHDHKLNSPTPALTVWATVFGILPPNGNAPEHDIEDEVRPLLGDIREEINTIENSTKGTEMEPLFAPLAARTRELTKGAQLLGPAPIPWTVFRLLRLKFWVFAYLLNLIPQGSLTPQAGEALAG
jgi:hypothetical protein